MSPRRILRIAVFAPLRSTFDYLCPLEMAPHAQVGARVLVPFGRGRRLGIVLEIRHDSAVAEARLKQILRILDNPPLLDEAVIALAGWVADYYHHPLGDVFETLLPTKLRRAEAAISFKPVQLVITDDGRHRLESPRALGPRQAEILQLCATGPVVKQHLRAEFNAVRVVRQLLDRGWLVEQPVRSIPPRLDDEDAFLTLSPLQVTAYEAITRAPAGFRAHLLHGITGSGKTEIYLHLIRDVIGSGGQALVLVPEIGLTEQLVARFRQCFGAVAVIHSGLSESARAATWLACRENSVKVLLGTRSGVWLPLPALRVIVVDEEHDLSYKQQDGLKYSARDIAVMRAHRAKIPIVLSSATPSLESFANCERGKYAYIEINERAGNAEPPKIKLIDIRGLALTAGISEPLRAELSSVIGRGEQSLLFLNRRGFAPIILCHRCGWIATCERCDARLVLHKVSRQLRCHHCGSVRSVDSSFAAHPCGHLSDYVDLGVGTEQIEDALSEWFPTRTIVRIDRDTVPRKGQLARALAEVHARQVDILVGTQMISKGHDFAGVTLVGIVDGDSRLHANDFRAEERFIQTVLQVAGRAGRARQAGLVLIQTHYPHHPIFKTIVSGDYREFAQRALRERAAAELPPYYSLALVRAEAALRALPMQFLNEVAVRMRRQTLEGVSINGPIPAAMEKRVGKYRANLLLLASERSHLALAISLLLKIIEKLPTAKRVRWTLDIDAQEVA